ncbi:hypothetical protein SR870_23590 [Rhodopseudomonas palustris]|uniref:hypothetical protein n=1 Tax=Rhodopseudomonas palustris TaxID=1076 RepID=UPI002ACDC010|nr:hypothetical protein [Rhodopseudomonas palustris]WQG99614.1 hypothetical protein SR870_23590 [Rhodopseudomonas palustris]
MISPDDPLSWGEDFLAADEAEDDAEAQSDADYAVAVVAVQRALADRAGAYARCKLGRCRRERGCRTFGDCAVRPWRDPADDRYQPVIDALYEEIRRARRVAALDG